MRHRLGNITTLKYQQPAPAAGRIIYKNCPSICRRVNAAMCVHAFNNFDEILTISLLYGFRIYSTALICTQLEIIM